MIRAERLLRGCGRWRLPTNLACFNSLWIPSPSHFYAFAQGHIHALLDLTNSYSTVLLWVELYLPKRYVVEVLTLGTCECIIWK